MLIDIQAKMAEGKTVGAEQVIMFVMQKDWRYAEPVMASRVGKQYTLKKQSETYTILE